jgi:hypothetical protein
LLVMFLATATRQTRLESGRPTGSTQSATDTPEVVPH